MFTGRPYGGFLPPVIRGDCCREAHGWKTHLSINSSGRLAHSLMLPTPSRESLPLSSFILTPLPNWLEGLPGSHRLTRSVGPANQICICLLESQSILCLDRNKWGWGEEKRRNRHYHERGDLKLKVLGTENTYSPDSRGCAAGLMVNEGI